MTNKQTDYRKVMADIATRVPSVREETRESAVMIGCTANGIPQYHRFVKLPGMKNWMWFDSTESLKGYVSDEEKTSMQEAIRKESEA